MQQAVRDVTENVSAGGLFIRTDRDLREGDRVPLQVSFPGLLEPVEFEVEVVRRRAAGPDQPRGVAVKIPADHVEDRQKLARIAESARPGQGKARRTYRVLVVEDNARIVEMYQFALRKLRTEGEDGVDVAVEYAPNGHEALARLVEPPPIDLVMADLYMPIMDGFALVERMRTDPALAATPIVIISAGGPDARDRVAELGIDVFLQKPVQFADIISTVRTLLRIR
jgi:uncharacterized protein (TIGR02266 family)